MPADRNKRPRPKPVQKTDTLDEILAALARDSDPLVAGWAGHLLKGSKSRSEMSQERKPQGASGSE